MLKEEILEKIYPHSSICNEKIDELESKFGLTAPCLCEPELQEKRKKLSESLDLYAMEFLKECFEIIKSKSNNLPIEIETRNSDYRQGMHSGLDLAIDTILQFFSNANNKLNK